MSNSSLKYGNHTIYNENNGYMYNYSQSDGRDFGTHIHKCYEFIHVIKGNLLYTVNGYTYTVSDGDFIMTNLAESHSFSFPDSHCYYREFLHIYPDFIKDFPLLLNTLDSRPSGNFNLIPAKFAKKYGIDKIFDGINEYCKNPVSETDFMVLTYTLQLITKINQIINTETLLIPTNTKLSKSQIICDYIDHHFMENITVSDIASIMFMSDAYMSRLFRKETGMTIKSYLNLRRITQAKNKIMEGQKATNIFSECGFSDYSTFYRAFIKHTGISPDKFKNMQKKS